MSYIPPTPQDIRALRGALTQKEFAAKIFVSASAVEKFESGGRQPSLHTWELAKAVFNHPDALMVLKNQYGL